MKKVVVLGMALAVLCLLLVGCGGDDTEKIGSLNGATGDFYDEFRAEELTNGSYKITATAHVENVLPLVYFNAAEETTLEAVCNILAESGGVQCFYVYENGEELLWEILDDGSGLAAELNMPVDLAVGESHLEFRTSDGAELQFELIVPAVDGVEFFMHSPAEGEFDELPEIAGLTDEQSGLSFSGSGESMSCHNIDKKLTSNEPNLLLNCTVEQVCDLPVNAALWDLSGDVQLVYVQPDGTAQLLWDSREQDGAEQPQAWQNPWDYILPEEVDMAGVLTIDLSVNLLPGEGRLEWQTENGSEFKLNLLLEDLDGLAYRSISF